MRSFKTLFVALIIVVTPLAFTHAQQGVSVTIERIARNDQISGRVTGLTEVGRKNHKVVVYVKTDQWYIHPHAQGGEGKSWATIAADGSWRIPTVKRDFSASSVAALVIPMQSGLPSTVQNVRDISHQAIVVRGLEGTPNFGDL